MDMAGHCRFCVGIAEYGYYFFLRGLSFSSEIASDEAPYSSQHRSQISSSFQSGTSLQQ
jgi:hypothetical protein